MRYACIVLTCVAHVLLAHVLFSVGDNSVVKSVHAAELPQAQGNAQSAKPLPGLAPIQSTPPQLQYSNELKTLQGVERLEQRVALIEAILKSLVGKIDILSETTRVTHEQQRLLAERVQVQTEPRHEYPPAQRWEVMFSGGAVLDKETGLIWQRQVGTATMLWLLAPGACNLLGVPNILNPHRGWRLPTVQELSSLAPLTQQSPFTNVQWDGKWYWTSTVNTASRPYHAGDGEDYPSVYAVGFSPTGSYVSPRATEPGSGSASGVWCVR